MLFKHLKGMALPSYLTVEIVEEDDSLAIYVHSTVHVAKRVKLEFRYALNYPIEKVLHDQRLIDIISQRYGFREVTKFEVT